MKTIILLALFCLIGANAIAVGPNKHTSQNKPQPVQGDEDCGMCQFVVGQVENLLKSNATDTEIVSKVEDLCNYLVNPGWISDCKNIVGQYGPQIIQAIASKETPTQICTFLQLCNSTQVEAPADVNGGIECLACTFIVKQAEGYLQANHSETEIIAFLSNDCKILKDQNWVATCQGLVQTYGPQIIQLLVNKADPNTVCDDLHLCNSTIAVPSNSDFSGGAECMMCEWLVGQIENMVAANSTETQIISTLNNACTALKEGTFVAMCQAVVTEYAPEMISLLINEQTPSRVCTEITLCTSSVNNKAMSVN